MYACMCVHACVYMHVCVCVCECVCVCVEIREVIVCSNLLSQGGRKGEIRGAGNVALYTHTTPHLSLILDRV